jgi:hypothetical protein
MRNTRKMFRLRFHVCHLKSEDRKYHLLPAGPLVKRKMKKSISGREKVYLALYSISARMKYNHLFLSLQSSCIQ